MTAKTQTPDALPFSYGTHMESVPAGFEPANVWSLILRSNRHLRCRVLRLKYTTDLEAFLQVQNSSFFKFSAKNFMKYAVMLKTVLTKRTWVRSLAFVCVRLQ